MRYFLMIQIDKETHTHTPKKKKKKNHPYIDISSDAYLDQSEL